MTIWYMVYQLSDRSACRSGAASLYAVVQSVAPRAVARFGTVPGITDRWVKTLGFHRGSEAGPLRKRSVFCAAYVLFCGFAAAKELTFLQAFVAKQTKVTALRMNVINLSFWYLYGGIAM